MDITCRNTNVLDREVLPQALLVLHVCGSWDVPFYLSKICVCVYFSPLNFKIDLGRKYSGKGFGTCVYSYSSQQCCKVGAVLFSVI